MESSQVITVQRSPGVRLRAQVSGAGETVLFVHGFPLSGRLWDDAVSRLAHSFRCVVPDLRGHGASDASDTASMGDHSDDLAAVLDAADETRPAVVVGLSMGGYVAFEMVRRMPDRVRALVLANTRAGADTAEAAAKRRETAEQVLRDGSEVVADTMVGKLFAPSADDDLRRRWHAIMRTTSPRGVAAALRAMADRPDSLETLRGFEGPVLVIAGSADEIVTVEDAEAMRDAASVARLEVVEGAGHMTPVEQPDTFAELVAGFVRSLPPLRSDGPTSG
jgi:3-oxoadipate enol-lactonase